MNVNRDLLEKYGLDLEGAVVDLIEQGNWKNLLDLSARFRSYSPLNLLLIFSQACRRGFSPTLVAGYRGWQRLGRQVSKGEKALYIFAPSLKRSSSMLPDSGMDCEESRIVGYKLVGVFDLSQTVGDSLPEIPEPVLLDSDDDGMTDLLLKLTSSVERRGFRVEFKPLEMVNGFTDFESREVKVRSDVKLAQQLKTLVHESAHVIMHGRGAVSRIQAELEAESCAYVVCRVLGIDSSGYSFPYVARWSHGDVDLVGDVTRSVHLAAGEILESLGL